MRFANIFKKAVDKAIELARLDEDDVTVVKYEQEPGLFSVLMGGQARRRQFDLVVDLQGLFRSAFIARATRAPIRIGPADARGVRRVSRISPLGRTTSSPSRTFSMFPYALEN